MCHHAWLQASDNFKYCSIQLKAKAVRSLGAYAQAGSGDIGKAFSFDLTLFVGCTMGYWG